MNQSTNNAIPPNVSVIRIPQGINDPNRIHYGKVHLQPQILYVVVNQNSTVRWINEDFAYQWIEAAQNSTDPGFRNAVGVPDSPLGTVIASGSMEYDDSPNVLAPGEYFEYTFTKPGEYAYFTGGESGKVIVSLSPYR